MFIGKYTLKSSASHANSHLAIFTVCNFLPKERKKELALLFFFLYFSLKKKKNFFSLQRLLKDQDLLASYWYLDILKDEKIK